MKRTKQQLVEENTSLKQQLSLANEQHNNVVDELNKLRSSCVSKSTYDDLYEDCERHIKQYNDCADKYHSKCDDYNKLNADKTKQIDNLTDQLRKMEHDHAACITREQYNKLEVQLASAKQNYDNLNDEYNKIKCDYVTLKDHSVSKDHYDMVTADKTTMIKKLQNQIADINKSNKWLLYSLVASLGALLCSLIW